MSNQDLTVTAHLAASRRPRVIIVGCGFGGLFAARALARADVEVLVIDRNNYHLFQPLLYQVASAALAPADIAQPIRTVLRGQANAFVMLGEATRIELARAGVEVGESELSFDYLILAPGAIDNYFGHDEWHRWAPGMKEVEDATFIRSRLLLSTGGQSTSSKSGSRGLSKIRRRAAWRALDGAWSSARRGSPRCARASTWSCGVGSYS